jgi:general secretion pathway protein E
MIRHEDHPELAFLESSDLSRQLSAETIERARVAFLATKQPIDRVARELGLIPDQVLCAAMAGYLDVQWTSDVGVVDEGALELLGFDFAVKNAILPVSSGEGAIAIAMADPFDQSAFDAVSYFLETDVVMAIMPRPIIEAFFRERGENAETIDDATSVLDAGDDDIDRLLDIAREAPVVKFVSRAIQRAVDDKATDIHVEPLEDSVRLRMRKDGILETFDTAPRSLAAGIASRIKILAKLNIAERRLPQDGRLRVSVRGQDVDFRVSVVPTIHGETIVLRILDRTTVKLELSALGYSREGIAQIARIMKRPNGIFLLTGPTGSGKTTTLYSILDQLNDAKSKIFTAEDPIEYRMRGVTQLQVDPGIGLSFASALRSILRQDPDIILVGEIRDEETAKIAVQAALTGHLVLSTLHTNSAVGAINRLRDMGIENYLLAATLRGVIGQRLVRRRCSACAGVTAPSACLSCHASGYSGRQAVYEILECDEVLQTGINEGASEQELQRIAVEAGMRPVSLHARELLDRGVTTKEEVARVLDLVST